MKQPDIPLQELLDLIECYFDCSLSDSEENRLRNIVAHTHLSHPSIDEVRALMGFRQPAQIANAHPSLTQPRKAIGFRKAMNVAAMIAVVIAIGIYLVTSSTNLSNADDEGICVAYVNGERITDEDVVIRLIAENLSEISNADSHSADALLDAIGEIAPIIELYESPNQLPPI